MQFPEEFYYWSIALHPDTLICTQLYLYHMTLAFGFGQGLRRDSFPARTTEVVQSGGRAKEPGLVSPDNVTNVYSLNRRTVMFKRLIPSIFLDNSVLT